MVLDGTGGGDREGVEGLKSCLLGLMADTDNARDGVRASDSIGKEDRSRDGKGVLGTVGTQGELLPALTTFPENN